MSVITARDLVREYSPGRGLCGVSLAVERGECVALLGRNGSGKTTFSRLVAGLDRPDSGSLAVLGHDVHRGARGHLAAMGIVLETSAHWLELTGRANAHFVAQSYGLRDADLSVQLNRLLKQVSLADRADDPVSTYSFGMRRKLSILEALCHDPDLLLLDEPTAGIDEQFLIGFAGLVNDRSERGKTTCITGTDAEWFATVADRVVFLDQGRVVAEGTVDALIAEVAPLDEVQLTLAHLVEVPTAARKVEGVRSWEQNGSFVTVLTERDPTVVPRLLQAVTAEGAEVKSLNVSRSTLRDAFLARTGRSLAK
jgi:ABC-type multidrug transport system ATPase subunit